MLGEGGALTLQWTRLDILLVASCCTETWIDSCYVGHWLDAEFTIYCNRVVDTVMFTVLVVIPLVLLFCLCHCLEVQQL